MFTLKCNILYLEKTYCNSAASFHIIFIRSNSSQNKFHVIYSGFCKLFTWICKFLRQTMCRNLYKLKMQTCTTFYSTFNGLRLSLARENHKLKKKKNNPAKLILAMKPIQSETNYLISWDHCQIVLIASFILTIKTIITSINPIPVENMTFNCPTTP